MAALAHEPIASVQEVLAPRCPTGWPGLSPALTAVGLTKRYGDTVAVAPLNLAVPRGSFFGLVGPNGAGKSTTLGMITGMLRPDRGHVAVAGIDVWSRPLDAKRHIGVLPESLDLFDRLTGYELLTYHGLLRSMTHKEAEGRAREALELFELDESADKMVADYSMGMRKKLGLAAALLHAPKVLFLDEPFESVDPVSARFIQGVLRQLVDQGSTVIFSSHVMHTVEILCDHVAIMDRGSIVAIGETEEVRAGRPLEDVFIELVGGDAQERELPSWLGTSSD